MTVVVARESFGSSSLKNKWILKPNGELDCVTNSPRFTSISQFFRSVFLPQGYPESVSDDYLQYQFWDTLQAFSSSITGALATQAVLKGIGVGDDSATVLAATVTWLMKDGTGKLGQIMFAWIQGSSLDCDCKRWRLFADVLNDVSIFIDIIAPVFLSYFRLLICVSGVCRSIVGVAGGSTRAALTQHQARRNNMADVSAKDGSQETLVQLAALLCSMGVMSMVTGHQAMVWLLYVLLTFLHLYANYQAVTSVTMETFNQSRLHIVVDDWLNRANRGQVIGVKEANRREPVLWKIKRNLQFNIGISLKKLTHGCGIDLASIIVLFKGSRYLLAVNSNQVNIALHFDSTWEDQLRACYHGEIINYCVAFIESQFKSDDQLSQISAAYRQGDLLSVLSLSQRYVDETFMSFCEVVHKAGWRTHPVQLCADEWRSDWNSLTFNKHHYS